jgi:hypothetical protein
MGFLFPRSVKLTVVSRPIGFIAENPNFFETVGNAIEIIAMRIRFEVTKNLGKEPNKCVIRLDNLSQSTRAELEKKPLKATLMAGHAGSPRLLFTGDITHAFSKREGTEIVTTLRVGDGFRAFAHGRMNRSYKASVSVKKVLEDCARSLNLKLPPEVEQSPELRQALATGVSAHGATRDVLTRVLAPYGYNWSMQNGQLWILKDEQVKTGHIHLISSASGPLVGIPEKTVPENPKGKTEIKCQTILFPELQPGQMAKLESEFLKVQFKMTDVKHVGDSYDNGDFTSDITGKPV